MGWNGQSLHMRMLLFQLPIPLPTLPIRLLHQGLSGQLFLCRRSLDEHIVKYFPSIGTLIGANWQKMQFSGFVLYSQTPCFLQILTGFPASMSHQTVFFQEIIQKKRLRLHTLLQSSDKSVLPGNTESNGGIDVCAKSLKTRFKTHSSGFFRHLQILITKRFNRAKNMPVLAHRLVHACTENEQSGSPKMSNQNQSAVEPKGINQI